MLPVYGGRQKGGWEVRLAAIVACLVDLSCRRLSRRAF
jgi:hypothetical protein